MRPADILDLERYYMRVVSKEQGVKLTLTQEAERALLAYSFPENITVRTSVCEIMFRGPVLRLGGLMLCHSMRAQQDRRAGRGWLVLRLRMCMV